MKLKILSSKNISNIEKIKSEFNIFRIIEVKIKNELNMIEFFNKDGIFRGFGTNSKNAYKKAKKALKYYYRNY